MPNELGREVGLLRKLAQNLEQMLLPTETLTQEFLRREGFDHITAARSFDQPFVQLAPLGAVCGGV